MLVRSGWKAAPTTLLDPFCGSGTVLIEAALMAADIAPGLQRSRFGFEHWRCHDKATWQEILEEAKARASLGVKRCEVKFYGSDIDSRLVALAKRNAQNAGVLDLIDFKVANALNVEPPATEGYLITNPPYGERLGSVSELLQLYYQLGDKFKRSLAAGKWLCSVAISS